MNQIIYDILKDLEPQMKPERYWHTLGVIYTAANLAYAHGFSDEKATLAAALHDCAKLKSIQDYIAECQRYGIKTTESSRQTPHLLHADLGAYFAREKYGITDEEILHAVQVHSTGCPKMDTLDMILYLADFIEPGRSPFPELEEIRSLAYRDLEMAVYRKADSVLSYAEQRGFIIDTRTVETRDYYKNIINMRR